MTNPQTEARAILAGRRLAFDNESGPQALIDAIATALSERDATIAAKDAELTGALVASERFSVAWRDAERRAERAEDQRDEALKALEPFAREAEYYGSDEITPFIDLGCGEFREAEYTAADLRAARRVREGGKNG